MIVKNSYAKECVIKSKTWFNIGKLIYFLSNGGEEGYRLWLTYSVSDQKNYKERYCFDIWKDFDNLMNCGQFDEHNCNVLYHDFRCLEDDYDDFSNTYVGNGFN